jgi:uncharacterized protein YbjT (DUF2867 family)
VRGGATLEQPIDADDVIEAVVAALEDPALAGQTIDFAGPECLSHRELVLRAAARLGTRPRIVPIPLGAARLAARLLKRLVVLEVLEHDDRVDAGAAAAKLGIELTSLESTLRRCLA